MAMHPLLGTRWDYTGVGAVLSSYEALLGALPRTMPPVIGSLTRRLAR